MRTALSIGIVLTLLNGSAIAQATQPTTSATSPDQLRAMIANLQKQIAELKQENASLKRQLAAAGITKGKTASKSPAGAGDFDQYAKDHNIDDKMLDRMRRFSPAVGMNERDLDFMVEMENRIAHNRLAEKETVSEVEGARVVRYTFFRAMGDGPRQQEYSVRFDADGNVKQVSNNGPAVSLGSGLVIEDSILNYLRKLGPDPKP